MEKLNWDEYFMGMVQITSKKSKDPNTKVGAIIINDKNRIIGTGYNGMPKGDDTFPWERDGEKEKTKYPYVIHAEINAILNSTVNVENSKIYVTLFPCSGCAKLLAHAGIKEIIYLDDKYKDTSDDKISKRILEQLKVKYRKGPQLSIKIKK